MKGKRNYCTMNNYCLQKIGHSFWIRASIWRNPKDKSKQLMMVDQKLEPPFLVVAINKPLLTSNIKQLNSIHTQSSFLHVPLGFRVFFRVFFLSSHLEIRILYEDWLFERWFFWLVLKLEISYCRVIIISWKILNFFRVFLMQKHPLNCFLEEVFWRLLYFCMVKYIWVSIIFLLLLSLKILFFLCKWQKATHSLVLGW
jgi:hypothetical protein